MRLVPILVPAAIATALGLIVALQAGWLDASAPEPIALVRSDRAIHGTPPTPVSASAEPTAVGRSVGKGDGDLGSGGASLAMDGIAAPVAAASAPSGPPDALQDARDEAAKAKQDVLEVTQASLAAQRASDAEFERQKGELNAQIAQLRETIDQAPPRASTRGDGSRNDHAEADLDRAWQEVATLKQQLAASQPVADNGANEKIAAAERASSEAQARAKSLGDQVATLETEVAAKTIAAEKAATAEGTLAQSEARAKDQAGRIADLTADLTASRKAAEPMAAKAEAADRLQGKLAAARQREDALLGQVAALSAEQSEAAKVKNAEAAAARKVAVLQEQLDDSRQREADADAKLSTMQARVTGGDDRTKQVQAASGEAASLQRQLAEARGREKDLGAQVAALQGRIEARTAKSAEGTKTADVKTSVATIANQATAKLQDDLVGARRGEDTLRKENGVLQRELAEAQTARKMIGEKLAALQVGMGVPVPPVPPARPYRAKVSQSNDEHDRLTAELAALKREQMHQQVQALRLEAADIGRAHRGRDRQSAGASDQGARFVTSLPASSTAGRYASRRREPQGREADVAASAPTRAADRFSALRPPHGDRDGTRTIAQARALIQSGDVDGAREVLRRRGGAVATRALADTYNPMVNPQLGVFGIDSDSDKAAALYQQAARSGR